MRVAAGNAAYCMPPRRIHIPVHIPVPEAAPAPHQCLPQAAATLTPRRLSYSCSPACCPNHSSAVPPYGRRAAGRPLAGRRPGRWIQIPTILGAVAFQRSCSPCRIAMPPRMSSRAAGSARGRRGTGCRAPCATQALGSCGIVDAHSSVNRCQRTVSISGTATNEGFVCNRRRTQLIYRCKICDGSTHASICIARVGAAEPGSCQQVLRAPRSRGRRLRCLRGKALSQSFDPCACTALTTLLCAGPLVGPAGPPLLHDELSTCKPGAVQNKCIVQPITQRALLSV